MNGLLQAASPGSGANLADLNLCPHGAGIADYLNIQHYSRSSALYSVILIPITAYIATE
jgi:hypothetical protein